MWPEEWGHGDGAEQWTGARSGRNQGAEKLILQGASSLTLVHSAVIVPSCWSPLPSPPPACVLRHEALQGKSTS